MRVLFVTQALDLDEPVLSTYHEWVSALANRVDHVEAICLKEGRHELPKNVRVHSLGKEDGRQSKMQYALRFFLLSWKLRNEYDVVFVHMNQEYILISGWLWKLLGKRVYLWRNHYAGSFLTDVTSFFCTKIFCTSRYSYTARYKKTVFMPVGVDVGRFIARAGVVRKPQSILFFSRMSPSKRPEILLEVLALLKEKDVSFTASFYGSPLPEDVPYYEGLKRLAEEKDLNDVVSFFSGVVNKEAPDVFQAHEIFVNCSRSGMFDKVLFEAAASGCLVLAVSEDLGREAGSEFIFDEADPTDLAEKIEKWLAIDLVGGTEALETLMAMAKRHSSGTLFDTLYAEMGT
ncbi:MAG: hypothetical protein QG636_102 [Patescibacteria group bacterium]|nr:hypothetical protein [Patescibacteria group bacterium]